MSGNENDLQEAYNKAKECDRIIRFKRNYNQNWPGALQSIVGMIFLLSLTILIGHCNHWWNVPFLTP